MNKVLIAGVVLATSFSVSAMTEPEYKTALFCNVAVGEVFAWDSEHIKPVMEATNRATTAYQRDTMPEVFEPFIVEVSDEFGVDMATAKRILAMGIASHDLGAASITWKREPLINKKSKFFDDCLGYIPSLNQRTDDE